MEERVIELELRYTHQQEELEKLSAVVYEQSRTIDALKAELVRIVRLLEGVNRDEPMPHEKPPHY